MPDHRADQGDKSGDQDLSLCACGVAREAPRCRPTSVALTDLFRQELDELAKRPGEIVNADMAKHISTLAHGLSHRGAGKAPDAAALEPLMGRRPLSFREFIRTRRGQFVNESVR
jgi:hypothetical protein